MPKWRRADGDPAVTCAMQLSNSCQARDYLRRLGFLATRDASEPWRAHHSERSDRQK